MLGKFGIHQKSLYFDALVARTNWSTKRQLSLKIAAACMMLNNICMYQCTCDEVDDEEQDEVAFRKPFGMGHHLIYETIQLMLEINPNNVAFYRH